MVLGHSVRAVPRRGLVVEAAVRVQAAAVGGHRGEALEGIADPRRPSVYRGLP